MIRPLTIATCLLACGSGLYLYQSKHEVGMLDRTIEKTVHDTNALREQSRLLAAEWTMLNDPQRLQQFSNTYLTLKSIAPTQFTSLADLDSRLPAPAPEPVAPPAAEPAAPDGQAPAPVVADAAPADVADPATDAPGSADVADDTLPVPPIPAMPPMPKAPTVAAVARPDTRTAERPPVSRATDNPPRSVAIADARPFDQRPNEQRQFDPRPAEPRQFEPRQAEQRAAPRVMEARTEVRPPMQASSRPIVLAAPRPAPAYAPVNTPPRQYRAPMVAESTPYGGSLLGMAHAAPPTPRPTPVSASYNSD